MGGKNQTGHTTPVHPTQIDNMKKRVNNSKSKEFETAIYEIHKIAKLRIQDLSY